MNETQKRFIDLNVIEQLTYKEIEVELGISRKEFSPWYEEFKDYRIELSSIRQKYRSKEGPNFDVNDFWKFYNWFKTKGTKCHYCEITQEEIDKLFKSDKVNTKRQNTRGRKLEIERLEPNKPYSEVDNLVSCCYWCNNAKTDEFSENEFMEIGLAIGKIWEARSKTK